MDTPDETTELNPYAPPQADVRVIPQKVVFYHPAGNGKRLLNYLLDQAGIFAVGIALGFVLILLEEAGAAPGAASWLETVPDLLVGLVLGSAYYLSLEMLSCRTLGKLLTGTKVVDIETGGKPGFGRMLGRTLSRFIPFEPLSFLGHKPGGWHDRFSGTMVVDLRKPIEESPNRPPQFFYR